MSLQSHNYVTIESSGYSIVFVDFFFCWNFCYYCLFLKKLYFVLFRCFQFKRVEEKKEWLTMIQQARETIQGSIL